jgi:hypothetical protein
MLAMRRRDNTMAKRDFVERGRAVARVVLQWIRTAKAAGYTFQGEDGLPSEADVWHSALLERLLRGEPPLPTPPPLFFSYPWYELVENGEAVLDARCVSTTWVEYGLILIGQAVWKIHKTLDNYDYVVEYHEPERTPDVWRLQKQEDGTWRLWREPAKERE